MAFFTSAYKLLAHLAPNWDTQLRADMQSLEDGLAETVFGPGLGGTGATLGNNPGFTCLATRKGQTVTYNGTLTFGSAASFGSGSPVITGLNQFGAMNTAISGGYGQYRGVSGNPTVLQFVPASNSTMVIRYASTGGLITGVTPTQSDQLWFHMDIVLA